FGYGCRNLGRSVGIFRKVGPTEDAHVSAPFLPGVSPDRRAFCASLFWAVTSAPAHRSWERVQPARSVESRRPIPAAFGKSKRRAKTGRPNSSCPTKAVRNRLPTKPRVWNEPCSSEE